MTTYHGEPSPLMACYPILDANLFIGKLPVRIRQDIVQIGPIGIISPPLEGRRCRCGTHVLPTHARQPRWPRGRRRTSRRYIRRGALNSWGACIRRRKKWGLIGLGGRFVPAGLYISFHFGMGGGHIGRGLSRSSGRLAKSFNTT